MSNRIIRNLPDSKYKAVVGNTLAGGSNPFGTESEITDQVTESEIVNGLNVGIKNTNVDAAYIATDGIYRMPTKTECDELINNCTWTWSTQNGVNGYTVEGNGNSIFIPASGYRNGASLLNDGTEGYLWTDTFIDEWAFMVMFSSSQHNTNGSTSRYYGRTIRPVSSIEGVDLGLPSGLKWASVNIGATLPEDYGDYFAWAETETKESFTSENYICPSGSEGTELDPVTHVTKYSLVNILHKNNPNIHTSPEKEARWDYKEGIKRFQVQAAVSGYAILDKLTSPCVIMINGSTIGYVNPAAFIFWRSGGAPYSMGKVTAKHNGGARTLGISLSGIYGQGVNIAVIPLTDTEYTGTLSIGSYSGAAVIANEGVLEKIANKTNDINPSSTLDQYPNAKAVYDILQYKLVTVTAGVPDTTFSNVVTAYETGKKVMYKVNVTNIGDLYMIAVSRSATQIIASVSSGSDILVMTHNSDNTVNIQLTNIQQLLVQGNNILIDENNTIGFDGKPLLSTTDTVASSGTALDLSNLSVGLTSVVLDNNCTVTLPTYTANKSVIFKLKVIQDGTGGRNLIIPNAYNLSEFDFTSGTANQRCWVTLLWDGSEWCYTVSEYFDILT